MLSPFIKILAFFFSVQSTTCHCYRVYFISRSCSIKENNSVLTLRHDSYYQREGHESYLMRH